MTADPVLVIAWLVLAHLAADFVFQTGAMVRAKSSPGGRLAVRGLLAHGLAVAACLVPVGIAFGAAGWATLVVVAVSHALVDRAKVLLTRRAEARALTTARRAHAVGEEEAESLGAAWTPLPGALFALDQLVHLAITLAAWAVFLARAPVWSGFADAVDRLIAGLDPRVFHDVALVSAVGVSLAVVNIRAGSLFVATLVEPRAAVEGHEPVLPPGRASSAPPERVGEAIGILERLLIVALLLTGAEAAIGLVIAAKTLARFKQLDDRDFAEYYLLGTLASVAVALGSALLARAALSTI